MPLYTTLHTLFKLTVKTLTIVCDPHTPTQTSPSHRRIYMYGMRGTFDDNFPDSPFGTNLTQFEPKSDTPEMQF